MKALIFLPSLLVALAAWVSLPAGACGEGIYVMSESSRHQGYLAPRLATVLVYNDQAAVPEATKAVYRGLVHAGHTLEVARNPAQLAIALQQRRYDVVIASYDQIDVVAEQVAPSTEVALLPVLTATQRGANGWRQRFRFSLAQDASLGQYLKRIYQLVKQRT